MGIKKNKGNFRLEGPLFSYPLFPPMKIPTFFSKAPCHELTYDVHVYFCGLIKRKAVGFLHSFFILHSLKFVSRYLHCYKNNEEIENE